MSEISYTESKEFVGTLNIMEDKPITVLYHYKIQLNTIKSCPTTHTRRLEGEEV
jgi:hypothetical protein